MKMALVRCWRVGGSAKLFITYPEGDMGHRLIICNNCGCVHAVNVTKQLYIEPDLNQYLASVGCYKCGQFLGSNWLFYPDKYFDGDGNLANFDRSFYMPDDADSIVVEFPEVFS